MTDKLHEAIKDKIYLVFDFDLTIAKMKIDWSGWHKGMLEVYLRFDPHCSYSYGKDPHNFYNNMVQKYGITLVKAVRKFNENYEKLHTKGFTASQYLVDFIMSLKGKKLYIYSSNSRKTIEAGLKELGIFGYFQQIISRDETNYLKPNPEGLNLIAGFNQNKASFIMIGDSSSDELAAKGAGIDFYKYDEFGTYKF